MKARGVGRSGGVVFARWSFGINPGLEIFRARQIQFVAFFEDLAGTIEGVLKPEAGRGKVMCGSSFNAIFNDVAFLQAENARGFDSDVLIGGKVGDDLAGRIADGAGQEFGGAAGSVADTHERNIDLLEGAIVFEL